MKLSLSTLALIAAAAALVTPARAQNYPWCAIYSGGAVGGGTNCGFVSYEQCMATARGLGSFCYRNTQYVPPPGAAFAAAVFSVLSTAAPAQRHSGRLGGTAVAQMRSARDFFVPGARQPDH
jgi:hypothetical protein